MKITLCLLFASSLFGQRQEVGLLLGGSKPASRTLRSTGTAEAEFSTGRTFYFNYGLQVAGGEGLALVVEVPFLATPQHKITSRLGEVTRDIATLYLTPGIRLRFAPKARISPYLAVGGGYAQFEQSTQRIDGQPNAAPRRVHRGAFDFGGGIDVPVWRFFGLRAEVRDFISGNPAFQTAVEGGTQHNVIFSGGFVLRF